MDKKGTKNILIENATKKSNTNLKKHHVRMAMVHGQLMSGPNPSRLAQKGKIQVEAFSFRQITTKYVTTKYLKQEICTGNQF